jgi:hypothetical protein
MLAAAPRPVPSFALMHGQARWVLRQVFSFGDTERTFDAYLKYLRREGLPFAAEEMGVGRGYLLRYRYVHLMELAVALYLRSQAILPTDVVRVLAGLRADLRPIYEQAYSEGRTGLGRPVKVAVEAVELVTMRGVSLDLRLAYLASGALIAAGQPQPLGPAGLIHAMATQNRRHSFRDPIPLTDLAEEIVRLAPHAPKIRRGRP